MLLFLYFLFIGLASQGQGVLSLSLPVFDRLIIVLSLAFILWAWVFPETTRSLSYGLGVLSLFLASTAILTVAFWITRGAPNQFNTSSIAVIWSVIHIGVIT